MTMISALLQQAVTKGVLRALDVQLAQFLTADTEKKPLLLLAIAWLSLESRSGHVCLSLSDLTQERLFNGRENELAAQIWQSVGEPQLEDWLSVLNQSSSVSDGTVVTPLVLQHHRLYLQRMWLDEGYVAEFFNRAAMNYPTLTADAVIKLQPILDKLFTSLVNQEVNWQKIAVAIAATRQVSIISGGPGTGKTTTVARLLATLIQFSTQPLRIVLAAPTGKAAARLTESLGQAIMPLSLTKDQLKYIPQEAWTLHRLLGAQANSRYFRHHHDNPLHLDVLIVDEASMVDLPMMARLIEALPPQAKLILLGDRDQLASVEAGAVLGDICRFIEQGYSEQRVSEISQLTGYQLSANQSAGLAPIRDNICLLRKSYRFSADSGIGQLALAVNQGLPSHVLDCFKQCYRDLVWQPLITTEDYGQMLEICIQGYATYLKQIKQQTIAVTLELFNHFQVLCALREGPFGVVGLNSRIEQMLIQQGLIQKLSTPNMENWYAGRPIMILRNDNNLGLYNGDIGIAAYDDTKLLVYFKLPDGTIKAVAPNRLPEHETAFAMTVHKSQGSEFNHTVFVLPDTYTPLLTRELVYTAITRAKEQLTLFGHQSVFSLAVRTPTERQSGLMERLSSNLSLFI